MGYQKKKLVRDVAVDDVYYEVREDVVFKARVEMSRNYEGSLFSFDANFVLMTEH